RWDVPWGSCEASAVVKAVIRNGALTNAISSDSGWPSRPTRTASRASSLDTAGIFQRKLIAHAGSSAVTRIGNVRPPSTDRSTSFSPPSRSDKHGDSQRTSWVTPEARTSPAAGARNRDSLAAAGTLTIHTKPARAHSATTRPTGFTCLDSMAWLAAQRHANKKAARADGVAARAA